MKRHLVVASFLGLAPALLAAQQVPAQPASQPIPLDKIVGVVGDQPITRFDVQERVLQKLQAARQPVPTDPGEYRAIEKATLDEMIDEELLVQKAKELKIEVSDNDLNASVDQQLKATRANFSNETEFRAELAKAGLGTPEEYKRFLIDQMRRNELIQRTIAKLREDGKIIPANISEADVREAFERNRKSLPPKLPSVTFRQIVINPKPSEKARAVAKAKAESLLVAIKGGADFELIAKRESMDPGSKEIGGDLGWQRMGQFVPEFDRWLFGPYALSPGALSPVVETPFGYHIIRVDRVKTGEVKARHILIEPVTDSAQVAKAKAEADSVAVQWRAGAQFDTLAKKHHDFANKEETSIVNPFPRDSLPPTYQTAFAGKNVNDIVTFQIPSRNPNVPKFVVAQLLTADQGGERTLDEMREMVRSRLAQEGGMRRYLDSLRKQTYVAVRLDDVAAAKP